MEVTKNQVQGLRVAAILNALNMKQARFAQETGIKQSQISKVVNGSKQLSFGMIEKILAVYPHININRVFTGYGPVLLPVEQLDVVSESQAQYIVDPKKNLEFLRKHLVTAIQLLDSCQKLPDDENK